MRHGPIEYRDFRHHPEVARHANMLTCEEARWMEANFAKLPELLGKGSGLNPRSPATHSQFAKCTSFPAPQLRLKRVRLTGTNASYVCSTSDGRNRRTRQFIYKGPLA
jgi:hypothetical protein